MDSVAKKGLETSALSHLVIALTMRFVLPIFQTRKQKYSDPGEWEDEGRGRVGRLWGWGRV